LKIYISFLTCRFYLNRSKGKIFDTNSNDLALYTCIAPSLQLHSNKSPMARIERAFLHWKEQLKYCYFLFIF